MLLRGLGSGRNPAWPTALTVIPWPAAYAADVQLRPLLAAADPGA